MEKKKLTAIENQIKDALNRPLKTFISDFLDENEQEVAKRLLNKTKREYRFDGGYEEAIRKILIIAPENRSLDNIKAPISAITFKKPGELSHRNVLGTFMSLGVERDTIGDIAIWDDLIQVVVLKRLSEYFLNNLEFINNSRIYPEAYSYNEIIPFELKYELENATAASNRLDAICASIFKTSRSKAAEAINKGFILLNHIPENKITTLVKEGDYISMKGKGKTEMLEFNGKSRKGRVRFSYKRYL